MYPIEKHICLFVILLNFKNHNIKSVTMVFNSLTNTCTVMIAEVLFSPNLRFQVTSRLSLKSNQMYLKK